jgi:hypothetical protein
MRFLQLYTVPQCISSVVYAAPAFGAAASPSPFGAGGFGAAATPAASTPAFGGFGAATSQAPAAGGLFGAATSQPASSGFSFGGSSTPAFGAAASTPAFGGEMLHVIMGFIFVEPGEFVVAAALRRLVLLRAPLLLEVRCCM